MLTRDALIGYIGTNLGADTSKIADDTPLFSAGLIDSFAMVDLLLFIETEAGTKINPMDVNLDNLDTVERIMAFSGTLTAK